MMFELWRVLHKECLYTLADEHFPHDVPGAIYHEHTSLHDPNYYGYCMVIKRGAISLSNRMSDLDSVGQHAHIIYKRDRSAHIFDDCILCVKRTETTICMKFNKSAYAFLHRLVYLAHNSVPTMVEQTRILYGGSTVGTKIYFCILCRIEQTLCHAPLCDRCNSAYDIVVPCYMLIEHICRLLACADIFPLIFNMMLNDH